MSTPGALLFHVHRMDGTVTGPHAVGVIRRGLQSGEFGPDTPLCLLGTEDWLPLSEWQSEIDGPPATPPRASGLSPAAAHWISQQQPGAAPGRNSALRTFWGVIVLLNGLSVFAYALALVSDGNTPFAIISTILASFLLWGGCRLLSLQRA